MYISWDGEKEIDVCSVFCLMLFGALLCLLSRSNVSGLLAVNIMVPVQLI